jgi:nucleotide-binding universal stress UspA family protein
MESSMLRSILVPVDGSPFSEQSLEWASSIAGVAGAALDIVLVHAPYVSVDDFIDGSADSVDQISDNVAVPVEVISDDPHINKDYFRDETKYLEDLQKRLTRDSAVRIRIRHPVGNVVKQLEEDVAKHKSDLVVMTTHGRGMVSRFWLGSAADELIRRLPVPILLIRPDDPSPGSIRHGAFRRILIPLDGSTLSESILEPALNLARLMKSEVTLLRVVSPSPTFGAGVGESVRKETPLVQKAIAQTESYLEKLAQSLRSDVVKVQIRSVVNPHAASAILQVASETEADLIALATHGRTGLPRIFLGSVADKVLRGASTPLLLVTPNWQVAHSAEK